MLGNAGDGRGSIMIIIGEILPELFPIDPDDAVGRWQFGAPILGAVTATCVIAILVSAVSYVRDRLYAAACFVVLMALAFGIAAYGFFVFDFGWLLVGLCVGGCFGYAVRRFEDHEINTADPDERTP